MLNGVLPILTDDVRECKAFHGAALVRNVDDHGLSLVRLRIPNWVDAAAVHLQGPTVEGEVRASGVVELEAT